MLIAHDAQCTVFQGFRRIASGDLHLVALKAKEAIDQGVSEPVLIFADSSGQVIDVDYRGTVDEMSRRLRDMQEHTPGPETASSRGPGRPKLGVVAREITLLPRHWDYLTRQPGGASVTLRKLVDEARKVNATRDRVREAQEAAYRFMTALAGDEPGFEEALRALFASNEARFSEVTASWPADIRDHAKQLAAIAFREVPSS
ncbi:MAG: DUF2239 family protein [Bryobacteraceae bacterium]